MYYIYFKMSTLQPPKQFINPLVTALSFSCYNKSGTAWERFISILQTNATFMQKSVQYFKYSVSDCDKLALKSAVSLNSAI